MLTLVLNLFLSALALMLTAYIHPAFDISNLLAAIVAVIMLGLMNLLITPILAIIRMPLNLMTIGLSTLVMNALLLNLVTGTIDGFNVKSWEAAILASLVITILQVGMEVWSASRKEFIIIPGKKLQRNRTY